MPMYTSAENIRTLLKEFVRVERYTDEEIEHYIRKAQTRIDTRLRAHYRVPFKDTVPEMVVSICEDFACSFLVDQDYVDRSSSDQVPLAQVYFRRAESDLKHILSFFTLDGLEGVERIASPAQVTSIATTSTPNPSPIKQVLQSW